MYQPWDNTHSTPAFNWRLVKNCCKGNPSTILQDSLLRNKHITIRNDPCRIPESSPAPQMVGAGEAATGPSSPCRESAIFRSTYPNKLWIIFLTWTLISMMQQAGRFCMATSGTWLEARSNGEWNTEKSQGSGCSDTNIDYNILSSGKEMTEGSGKIKI